MTESIEELLRHPENFKQLQQESLLLDVAALIYSGMRENKINRKELAARLKVSKGRISQYLGGERNLRLRTLADIFTELGYRFCVCKEPIDECAEWSVIHNDYKTIPFSQKKWVFTECPKDSGNISALAG